MQRGLYVHVPFCVRKCYYCDFNSYTVERGAVDAYLDALAREIALHARSDPPAFDTIYFGGGTPSILSGAALCSIVARLRAAFAISDAAEITLEANPGSLTPGKLAAWGEAGVNRVSLGVQSFDDELLARLGRSHSAQDAIEAIAAIRRAGFTNFNIDLMFGLPGQSAAQWDETLRRAIDLAPPHVSCYSLIIEEGTPYGEWYARGQLRLPGEDAEADMYERAIERLSAAGYEHYEISNFALPAHRSVHNQIYWRNEPYVGLGPGAHSYWRGVRTANVRPVGAYAARLRAGDDAVESRWPVGTDDEMDETMMLGLRLLEGVSEHRFRSRFGRSLTDTYGASIAALVRDGLLEHDTAGVRLSRRGLFLANRVFAAFLREPALR
ncbi:MAG TPA: radical SAM family heme chaperone HemW [Limnochordia bacterium]